MSFGKKYCDIAQVGDRYCYIYTCRQKNGGKRKKSTMYRRLESGFRDVREIVDGKQKRQTIDEFLNEIRNHTD